ncbi:MAG TPA: phage Gp37/Gp68 family protein [Gaiellaceae bacterium]|nr:phage Gp37/Gp68 family protein [Gaiellaceae bacterium]
MSDSTAIEWTDATWNPVTGCTRVSPGCANCYIERTPPFRMAGRRFVAIAGASTTGVQFHRDRLEQPLSWRRPRRVFVCSLADLFHDDVDEGDIRDVFTTMARAPQHTFQVLTKRPERARQLFERGVLASRWVTEWPLPNVWLGVSIENARFTWRADVLREIPAAVRFISAEPLLGSLFPTDARRMGPRGEFPQWAGPLDLTEIDWVIIGGESGPGARPFHLEHAREIIAAAACPGCVADPDVDESIREPGRAPVAALGVGFRAPRRITSTTPLMGVNACAECLGHPGHRPAVFVKQLGAKPTYGFAGEPLIRMPLDLNDRKGGDIDEWPADLRIREFPRSAA